MTLLIYPNTFIEIVSYKDILAFLRLMRSLETNEWEVRGWFFWKPENQFTQILLVLIFKYKINLANVRSQWEKNRLPAPRREQELPVPFFS